MDTLTWQAYSEYFSGKLEDRNYDEQELAMALAGLPSKWLLSQSLKNNEI